MNSTDRTKAELGQDVLGVPDLWERVVRAPYRLLALDYDGTLAPFRVERMEAVPLPAVATALAELRTCERTTVSIVSGRPVRELLVLLGEPHLLIIGAHGYERKLPERDIERIPLSESSRRGLDTAFERAVAAGLASDLERKTGSVALHVRGRTNPDALLDRTAHLWQPLADEHSLALRRFNGGIELRVPDRNKGTAVADLLDSLPENTLAVYVGDDDTDEDVFRVLRSRRGIGIRVGDPGERTAASGHLKDCAHVAEFLRTWRDRICAAPRRAYS